ncbi:MAG: L-idonate 5-dehydrogenase [Pseudomonadota bacterium]
MVKACVAHGAHDLRIDEREPAALGPGMVRVRLGAGGICGSDLHYYHEGGIAGLPIREPLILGHEMAGTIVETAADVSGFAPGMRVVVNPHRPCLKCADCGRGTLHLCADNFFAGSVARMPHMQGFFSEVSTVAARQCRSIPENLDFGLAALTEPLAVCMHGVSRAGPLLGKRVLITGSGPIGCLLLVAARAAGAAEMLITDLHDEPLAVARKMGADEVINIAKNPERLEQLQVGRGTMDVVLEASGNVRALEDAVKACRAGGTLVVVGMLPGDTIFKLANRIVFKELDVRGSFRFDKEFDWALRAIIDRRVDLEPVLTEQFPLSRAVEAFDFASDRKKGMKSQLVLG